MKKYNITVNGVAYAVEVEEAGAASAPAAAPAAPAPAAAPAAPAPAAPAAPVAAGDASVTAPMPGTVLDGDPGSYEDGKRNLCNWRWHCRQDRCSKGLFRKLRRCSCYS